jgi:biotin operon repressor
VGEVARVSIQAVSWVLDHSEAEGNARLVLIAIANHYDFNDPAVPVLVREARCSRSTVLRAIQALEEAGELVVERDPTRGRSRKNHYTLPGYERCRSDTILGVGIVPLEREMVSSGAGNGVTGDTRTIENRTNRRERQLRPSRDFTPTDEHRAKAKSKNLDVDDELDGWLTWCEATGKTYASLNAGFAYWLRNSRPQPRVATLEELATPRPRPRPREFVCAVGNPECSNGWIDTPRGAVECECRRKVVTV